MKENLNRLNGLVGKRGLLPVRSADGFFEVPFTFDAVVPPSYIPEEAGFETLNGLISRSHFKIRFDEGTLIDGANTLTVSGFHVVPEPKAYRQLVG